MACVDVILGHNVEYIGSMSGLPISVLECSKGGHLKRDGCRRGFNFGFFGR